MNSVISRSITVIRTFRRYTYDGAIIETKEISNRTSRIPLRGFCFTELKAVNIAVASRSHGDQVGCRKDKINRLNSMAFQPTEAIYRFLDKPKNRVTKKMYWEECPPDRSSILPTPHDEGLSLLLTVLTFLPMCK